MRKITNILIPSDYSAGALDAARQAVAWAKQWNATIHLLHVVEIESFAMMYGQSIASFQDMENEVRRSAETRMEGFLKDLGDLGSVPLQKVVRTGNPAQTICEYADEAKMDLIVMSTHGRTGLPRLLLGSVTERVVRTAPCPVLTLRYDVPE